MRRRGILLIGLPVSAAGFLVSALIFTFADLPLRLLPWIAAAPVLLGCYAAGRYTARRTRSHGWQNGAFAGIFLSALWYLAGWLTVGQIGVPTLLPAAVLCGMLGGVRGVSMEAPAIRRRAHGIVHLRERARLQFASRHAIFMRTKKPKAH